ncbi:MAG TPA: RNA polymerase sigma factor, partial [Chitinophagaceae bacterium]|nr:RNA polymerase sigma factor [Chitinophagaceae bacterium]
PKEYNQTVTQHADHLYRFVLKNLGHADDSKDVVQNAFEILWNQRDQVAAENAKTFLFTVGYRKMIDALRKTRKTELKEEWPEQLSGYTETRHTGLKAQLHKALETLPAIQKQLILLKDYEGYSYEESAKITGLNEGQVKVYLFRARNTLKKQLSSVASNL